MAGHGPIARRGWLIAVAALGALAAAGLLLVALVADRAATSAPSAPAGTVAGLLSWVPAAELAAGGLVAWTPDPGDPTTATAADALPLYDRLGLPPAPSALDAGIGWSPADVTGWAGTGDGGLVVMTGDVSAATVGDALAETGYRPTDIAGVDGYVAATDGTPASGPIPGYAAFAVRDGVLVAGDSEARVRAAVLAAGKPAESAARQPVVADALATLAPVSALLVTTQADLAAACDPAATGPNGAGAGRDELVLVGYGRAGEGGPRRTLIAVSYPTGTAASAHLTAFADGWQNGYVNARGLGGSLSAYGDVTSVGQTGRLLVAELTNGRDAGWVRAGIRYALPVCEAAMAAAPAATPDLTGGAGRASTIERLATALPGDGGNDDRFRAIDLQGLAAARGAAAPADTAASAWLAALGPIPALDLLTADAGMLAWAGALGIAPGDLLGIAEANAAGGATVGAVIGRWDEAALAATLSRLGYRSIRIGAVRHFAIDADTAAAVPFVAANPAWTNVALLGDRLWFSADQAAMRRAIDAATGGSGADGAGARPFLAGALAYQSEGAGAIVARCGAVLPGAAGFLVAVTANGNQTTVRVAVVAAEGDPAALASALAERIDRATIDVPSAVAATGAGTPAPLVPLRLAAVLARVAAAPVAPGAIAYALDPAARGRTLGLFPAILEGCRLTGAT